MASFIFRKQPSDTVTQKYSIEYSIMGKGLGRMNQTTAADTVKTRPGRPQNWPTGTDRKASVNYWEAK